MGVNAAESYASMAPIRVDLNKLEGTKLDSGVNPTSVTFDIDVNMDEEKRTNDELTINFRLVISTKPSLATSTSQPESPMRPRAALRPCWKARCTTSPQNRPGA